MEKLTSNWKLILIGGLFIVVSTLFYFLGKGNAEMDYKPIIKQFEDSIKRNDVRYQSIQDSLNKRLIKSDSTIAAISRKELKIKKIKENHEKEINTIKSNTVDSNYLSITRQLEML